MKKSGMNFDEIAHELYVPVICDVLDSLGYRQQALHQRLRPLDSSNCTFFGRARTVQWTETEYIVEEDPYGKEIEVMDSLGAGDVIVHSTDWSGSGAPWGELMSTVAKRNGCSGCVCDSQIRDCMRIMSIGFPVFYAGVRPVDSLGRARVVAYDVPIKCGEVRIQPGELVFADFDGIVVIPTTVEQQVIEKAIEKANKETASRSELRQGKTLREVYDKYHVL